MPEKRTYIVKSPEGGDWAGRELGQFEPIAVDEEVELEIYADQRTALVAAGWLEEKKPKSAPSASEKPKEKKGG